MIIAAEVRLWEKRRSVTSKAFVGAVLFAFDIRLKFFGGRLVGLDPTFAFTDFLFSMMQSAAQAFELSTASSYILLWFELDSFA